MFLLSTCPVAHSLLYFHLAQIFPWLLDVRGKYGHMTPGLSRHEIDADVEPLGSSSDLDPVEVLLMQCLRPTSYCSLFICNWDTRIFHTWFPVWCVRSVTCSSDVSEHPTWTAFPDVGGRLHCITEFRPASHLTYFSRTNLLGHALLHNLPFHIFIYLFVSIFLFN